MNLFGGNGYLTDEQRKKPLVRGCEYVTFKTSVDLSEPIEVSSHGNFNVSIEHYSRDLASFIAWWMSFVAKDLNGFSGFHNRKFKLNFKIVGI